MAIISSVDAGLDDSTSLGFDAISIRRPHTGCGEFHHMVIRIAEVEAASAARPIEGAFESHCCFAKAHFPSGVTTRWNGEAKMPWSNAFV